MICTECEKGMFVVLATKGQIHPYRERSILTHPERYFKKVPCPRCNGSGVAYCCDGEDASRDSATLYGEQASTNEDKSLVT